MLCLCNKTYCCYDVTPNKCELITEGLNKLELEQSGNGALEMYRRVLDENVNITSSNRGFRTNNHTVATYEPAKKDSPTFIQKEM